MIMETPGTLLKPARDHPEVETGSDHDRGGVWFFSGNLDRISEIEFL